MSVLIGCNLPTLNQSGSNRGTPIGEPSGNGATGVHAIQSGDGQSGGSGANRGAARDEWRRQSGSQPKRGRGHEHAKCGWATMAANQGMLPTAAIGQFKQSGANFVHRGYPSIPASSLAIGERSNREHPELAIGEDANQRLTHGINQGNMPIGSNRVSRQSGWGQKPQPQQ